MHDFFISYNRADEVWAIGLCEWLNAAGYTTVCQQQDFVPATNFAVEMHRALQNMRRMIMVLSPDYLSAKFPLAEWTAAFTVDPTCESGTLIPVRVRECKPDGLLRPIVYIDLVGLNASDAQKEFLDGIASVIKRKRPTQSAPRPASARKPKKPRLAQSVTGDGNTTIQAEHIANLTIKTGRKKAPSVQPLNVVGANVEMRAYVEYLVDRYIDWRQAGIKNGMDRRPFHPSMIHRDIKRDFGARTYLVPQTRFADLVHYLQVRINDTITGRNNKHRNFHTYDDHLAKLHGKDKSEVVSDNPLVGKSLPEVIVDVVSSNWSLAKKTAQANKCINNLRQIDGAMQQWALENQKPNSAIPSSHQIAAYMKGGVLPKCPVGGQYNIPTVGAGPTCSVDGHSLPH